MNPRRRHALLLGFAVLAATLRVAAQQPNPALPQLPGMPAAKSNPPADKKPAPAATVNPPATPPPAAEKKSDAKTPAAAPDTKATVPDKSAATPAPAKAKTKSASDPAAKAPVAPALSPRYLQIRSRIDALFAERNNPPAAPDVRTNPFRPPGAIPIAPLALGDGAVEPPPVNNNLVLLEQAVATLKVRGTAQMKNSSQLQLIITTGPGKEGTYKEGAIININLAPDPVHLRVRVITRDSVTLTLGDAEMVLKF